MIDRRDLMLAAGALAAPHGAWARGVSAAPAVALYDARYDEARRFAAALSRAGALQLETGRDVAVLWYGRLQHLAVAYPGLRLAGLATGADFLVIRGCAAEARLTVAHHAIHEGGMHHRTIRGEDHAAALSRAGVGWPEALAARLVGAPATTNAGPSSPVALVSWLIA